MDRYEGRARGNADRNGRALMEAAPPRHYGDIEQVISVLTEGLVRRGTRFDWPEPCGSIMFLRCGSGEWLRANLRNAR